MTTQEAIKKLKDILDEATTDENAVCYVTDYDEIPLRLAIKALEKQEYIEDDIREAKNEVIEEFAEFLKKKNLLTNFHYHNGEADFDYADIDGYVNEFKNQIE